MKLLLENWQKARSSKYSGDTSVLLLTWGGLRATTSLTELTIAALAIGIGLLSASVDFMESEKEE